MADPATWLCPVCEGVNHGGRVCSTCGNRLPDGFVPRSAFRTPAPPPSPPKVVRAPSAPRTPSPEEIFGSNPFRY
jgi:hypothetical protein